MCHGVNSFSIYGPTLCIPAPISVRHLNFGNLHSAEPIRVQRNQRLRGVLPAFNVICYLIGDRSILTAPNRYMTPMLLVLATR